ncbi:hypothetical protein [Vibrio sp. 1291-1]|uniref:hypothetical protein n=1 Tax=Vibrio sp. 1291-1 TaxID=3074551 RepID=UPI00296A983C|nr:hypothetical protein [Vibrio sp. 1291-1]MDW3640250.1 hypothetical protein [Vibrio sp. 1291-1]
MSEKQILRMVDESADDLLIKMSDQLFEQAHQLITLKLAPEKIRYQVLITDDRCQFVLSSFLYNRKLKNITIDKTSIFMQARDLQEQLIVDLESRNIM